MARVTAHATVRLASRCGEERRGEEREGERDEEVGRWGGGEVGR